MKPASILSIVENDVQLYDLPCCPVCKAPFNSVGAGYSVSYSEWMGWSGYDAPSYDNPNDVEAIEYDEDAVSWDVCTPGCSGERAKPRGSEFEPLVAVSSNYYQLREVA